MFLAQQVVVDQPSASLLQQLTPILGAVAALIGVWLGRFLETRTRREETVRTAALAAYTQFILHTHDCSRAAIEVLDSQGSVREEAAHERLRSVIFELRLAASEMEVVAPTTLSNRVVAVARSALKLSDELSTGSGIDVARVTWQSTRRWEPLETLESELAQFITEAKRDVHAPR